MAYIKEWRSRCDYQDCTSRASQEVYGEGNVLYGRYCKRHAKRQLAHVLELEKRGRELRALMARVAGEGEK